LYRYSTFISQIDNKTKTFQEIREPLSHDAGFQWNN